MRDQPLPLASTGLAGRPRALQVEITSHCNLKCTMCPLTLGATLSSISPAHMQEVVWEQVVEAARGVGRVIVTGFGENATNPKFPALLEELDALGIKTSFTTNAIGMRPKLVARLAELKHFDHVNVSIDSPDPEIYRTIRGGSFEKAWLGLETLIAGLPPRVRVTVSSVAMDVNIESLVAMPDRLKAIGVTTYHLQGLHDRTSVLADDDLRRNPAGPASVREIHRRCAELGIQLESADDGKPVEGKAPAAVEEPAFSVEKTRQCLAPWDSPFIDRDGRVFPCCHGDSTSVLGNLADATFKEVWNSDKFRQFRLDVLQGESLPPICGNCKIVSLGIHPLRYSASILPEKTNLIGRNGLKIVARNTGIEPWTAAVPLAIGAGADRLSALHVEGWKSRNRIAYMKEDRVEPGECATFEFAIGEMTPGQTESFGLVVEGIRWIPGAEFDLPQTPPVRPAIFRFDPAQPPRPPNYLERRWDGIRRRLVWLKYQAIGG